MQNNRRVSVIVCVCVCICGAEMDTHTQILAECMKSSSRAARRSHAFRSTAQWNNTKKKVLRAFALCITKTHIPTTTTTMTTTTMTATRNALHIHKHIHVRTRVRRNSLRHSNAFEMREPLGTAHAGYNMWAQQETSALISTRNVCMCVAAANQNIKLAVVFAAHKSKQTLIKHIYFQIWKNESRSQAEWIDSWLWCGALGALGVGERVCRCMCTVNTGGEPASQVSQSARVLNGNA